MISYLKQMDDSLVNAAIARVLLSTKRKSRQYSLLEIATDIQFLKNEKGGIKNVAKLIGISTGMLNQFLSIFKLPTTIVELIKERKIESVSLAHNLSKFKHDDAIQLAQLIINKGLTSQELKIILPYHRKFPNDPIGEVVERVKNSKNIKVSVIRFPSSDLRINIKELEAKISQLIGKENFLTIEKSNANIDLKVLSVGEAKLREVARNQKLSFQELIKQLIK